MRPVHGTKLIFLQVFSAGHMRMANRDAPRHVLKLGQDQSLIVNLLDAISFDPEFYRTAAKVATGPEESDTIRIVTRLTSPIVFLF